MKGVKIVLLSIFILFCCNANAQTKEYNIQLSKALNALYADLPNDCKNLFGKEDIKYKDNYHSKITLPNSTKNIFFHTSEYPIILTSYVPAGDDNAKAIVQQNSIRDAILATIINYKNKNYKILYLTAESKTGDKPDYQFKLENGPEELENVKIYLQIGDNTDVNEMYKFRIRMGIYRKVDKTKLVPIDKCISGNCKNGKGSIEFNNGDKYEGDFKNGYADGQGKYTEKTGAVYTGSLNKGKWDGFGTTRFGDGDVYIGNYRDDKTDGKGTYTYANGNILEGFFSNGKITKGKFTYTNGNYYDGEWENVKFNGEGKFYEKAINKLSVGIFKDNVLIKETNITTEKVTKIEGCITGDCKNGKGSIIYADGSKYEGDFKNGYLDGKGKFTYRYGRVYTGSFKNNMYNGFGTLENPDGGYGSSIYVGNFIDNKKDGKGKHTESSGNYSDGEWKNDKLNGQGKLYFKSSNTFIEGVFKDDKLLKKTEVIYEDGKLISETNKTAEIIATQAKIPSKEYNTLLSKAINALYADMPNNCKSLFGNAMENSKYTHQAKIILPNSIKNTLASYDDFPVIYESNITAGNDNELAKQQHNEINKAILSTTINYKNKNYTIKYLAAESNEGYKPRYTYSLVNCPQDLVSVKIYLYLMSNPDDSKPYKFYIAMGVFKKAESKGY